MIYIASTLAYYRVALSSSMLDDGWWFKHAQASQGDTLSLTCQASKPNEITKKKNSDPPIVRIRGEGSVTGHRLFSELLEWLSISALTQPSDMFLFD